MLQDEARVKELEERLRDLEEKLDRLQSSLRPGELGSVQIPIEVLYLKSKRKSAVARVTFDDENTDVLVERVR